MLSLNQRLFIIVFTCLLSSCEYDNLEIVSNGESVSYSMDIVPLITQKCAISGCHTNGAAIGNFNEYSAIKTRIDNGKFQLMVFDLELMPPATASPISFDERMKLKKWVDQGAINN